MTSVMYKGYTVFRDGRIIGVKGYLLKQGISSNGYYTIVTCYNGVKESELVHRIVAICFLSNEKSKRTVNHKNGIKTDNRVENLEWASDKENIRHAFKSGLCTNTAKSLQKRMSKEVINTSTGLKYSSAKIAAEKIGMNENTLRSMLCGIKKNKTSFKYSSNESI
jgi:hypothetical protein